MFLIDILFYIRRLENAFSGVRMITLVHYVFGFYFLYVGSAHAAGVMLGGRIFGKEIFTGRRPSFI